MDMAAPLYSDSIAKMIDKLPQVKEEYARLSLKEKRAKYRGSYTPLSKVPTWDKYFQEHKADILKNMKPYDNAQEYTYKVDKQLNSKISIWEGDIRSLEVDSIVTPATGSLMDGGGLNGRIHHDAGANLTLECITLAGCAEGAAKITEGYDLPCKAVIHTVGPVGCNGEILESCYSRSLQLMKDNKLRSIAFPCLAINLYGFPNEKAAHIALRTAREFLEANRDKVDRVIFSLFADINTNIYKRFMTFYFPVEASGNSETTADEPGKKGNICCFNKIGSQ